MSYLYDTVPPTVICDELLQQVALEQGPVEEAGRLAQIEGIPFEDVFTLRLDFKNILRMENLWELVNLTKLQLDNNIIEKIEGLECLVNLVSLDLSFNNIEVIEGLDTLRKLEDLSLYNNYISTIANMDNLQRLQILSLGNNNLTDLNNLKYLRQFKELRSLNLSNNPLTQSTSPQYTVFVASFIPSVVYLDYRIITDEIKQIAYEQNEFSIENMEAKDNIVEKKKVEATEKEELQEKYKKAFVANLDGSQLFYELYAEDPEGRLLSEMPDAQECLRVFKDKFTKVCHRIFEFGVKEYEKREEEIREFWDCVNEAKADNKAQGQKELRAFEKDKKEFFSQVVELKNPKQVEDLVIKYNDRVTSLWYNLMALEMTLLEQLEEVNAVFERNMEDMVAGFLETLQSYLAVMREAEAMHVDKILEAAHVTADRLLRLDDDLDDYISDGLRNLFVDKDTLHMVVQASQDAHMQVIDKTEDSIVDGIKGWQQRLLLDIHHGQEVVRNRARVVEINRFVDLLRDEIEALEMTDVAIQSSVCLKEKCQSVSENIH